MIDSCYFGQVGRLTRFRHTTSESVDRGERYKIERSLGGQVFAQYVPSVARSWKVSMPLASSSEWARVSEFASGAWGIGPFVWITAEAQAGNLLTPRQGRHEPLPTSMSLAGPRRGSDGEWAATSLLSSYTGAAGTRVVTDVPVVPGVPVTASLDVSRFPGGAAPRMLLRTMTATGGFNQVTLATGAATDGMQRISATLTPDALAAWARIDIMSDVQYLTRPQVTWTSGPVDYHPPAGCLSAILDGVTNETVVVSRGVTTYEAVSFTVQEVG